MLSSSLFPFKRVQDGFKNLGIEITRTFQSTFTKTFTNFFNKCKQNMNRWAFLPLSFVGHINLIKMIVLPKFLYLFQSILILIKKTFLKHLIKVLLLSYGGTNIVELARPTSKDQSAQEVRFCRISSSIIGRAIFRS